MQGPESITATRNRQSKLPCKAAAYDDAAADELQCAREITLAQLRVILALAVLKQTPDAVLSHGMNVVLLHLLQRLDIP